MEIIRSIQGSDSFLFLFFFLKQHFQKYAPTYQLKLFQVSSPRPVNPSLSHDLISSRKRLKGGWPSRQPRALSNRHDQIRGNRLNLKRGQNYDVVEVASISFQACVQAKEFLGVDSYKKTHGGRTNPWFPSSLSFDFDSNRSVDARMDGWMDGLID